MSLDQVWFRLCNIKMLKDRVGGRTKKIDPLQVSSRVKVERDGTIMGRAADGTPIRGRIAGKSLARRLTEKAEAEVKKKKRRKKG